MEKKRCVIITGAGAVIDWEAMTTCQITTELIKYQKLNEIIYNYLISNNKNANINFETIMNCIENLYSYYKNIEPKITPIFKINNLLENEILSIKDNQEVHSFIRYKYIENIKKIIEFIDAYSMKIRLNANNPKLIDFILELNKKYHIRNYTLNYDRFFDYATQNKIHFYDGFDLFEEDKPSKSEFTIDVDGEEIEGKKLKKFNLKKILEERNINCMYNLHGSIFWKWEDVPLAGTNQLKYSQYICMPENAQYHDMEESTGFKKNTIRKPNPEEIILNSKIITGYKKLQRLNFEPFSAFFNSFYRDCFEADIIFTIGYSFSDTHLNNIIDSALNFNSKVKFINITRNANCSSLSRSFIKYRIGKHQAFIKKKELFNIKLTFKEFLNNNNNELSTLLKNIL